ncbi:hypothetical protein ACQKD9_11935 [Bacillus paramycoides]|uniref:hypothetical protein n=1 Tax=Bacillus paramycoides TaxID=2026194 RepID=UPI003D07167D
MASKQVIFIQSVSGSIKYPVYNGQPEEFQPTVVIQNGYYGCVGEFEESIAQKLIDLKFAIPFADWKKHFPRPAKFTFL